MNTLPKWVSGLNAIWLTLGTLATLLAAQGVAVPSFLSGLLSDAVFQAIVQAGTAVFSAYQLIRTVLGFVPKAGVSILSAEKVRAYAFNPFKITV